MTPRLTGRTLRAARVLTAHWPMRALLRRRAMRESGVDLLAALPMEARLAADPDPRPLAGAPPRRWPDAGYASPRSARRGAEALRDVYATGERTPTDVADRLAARIAEGDFHESLHSPYIALDLDRARQAATTATARWRDGAPRSFLDGVPVPIKDHHHMAGLPTRGGTRFLTSPVEHDGALVARLAGAGALVYGKTHATEWGLGPVGTSPHFSMPRNPYDRTRAAGGSSTGTAVAIALGHAPCGIGSDGGGSVRIPAALCGLFGLKPSFLRIGRTGDLWSAGSCGTNGVLGQTARDCAELLAAASGRDELDTATWCAPEGAPGPAWLEALGRGVRGCRIGVWRWAMQTADPAIAAACEVALEALARDGAVLVDVDIPLAEHSLALGMMAVGVETAGFLGDVIALHGADTGEDVRFQFQLLDSVRAREYLAACRTRAVLRRNTALAMAGVDLLAAPTVGVLAPRYLPEEDLIPILDADAVRGLCRPAFLANLTGLPAGTAPVAMHAGLPIGLQLVGDAWDEASVLAAMAHCERIGVADLPPPKGYEPP